MKGSECFIIDICGTLFKSNTTFDFMKYYFENEKWYIRLNKIRKNKFLIVLNRLTHKLFKFDVIRYLYIRHLCGFSRSQLELMTSRYYEDFLLKRINTPIIKLIEKKRGEGFHLVIASATLDIISKEVAKRMGVEDQLSSELKYDKNDVCTGKLKTDLLARKLEYLRIKGIGEPFGGIVTDNDSDIDLIKRSKESCFVLYPGHKKLSIKNVDSLKIDYIYL